MSLKAVEIDQKKASAIIESLRANDSKTLTTIYKKTFPMVEKYILQNTGNSDDAKDIFQDAFYLLIRKANDENFELTAQPSTFLFGISKNLWLKELTKKRIDLADLALENEQLITTENDAELDVQHLDRVRQMKNCISALGEPCKTILEQFYFLKASMKSIAELLHYGNPEHAKNQKYKCFVRLKKMVTNSNLF